MPSVVMFLAQAPTPNAPDLVHLAGNSGWFGAGLLGLVLCWLLFWHLPKKDAQLENLMEKKDKHVDSLVATFTAALKTTTEKHEAVEQKNNEACKLELTAVLTHCQRESTVLAQAVSKEFELLRTELKGAK